MAPPLHAAPSRSLLDFLELPSVRSRLLGLSGAASLDVTHAHTRSAWHTPAAVPLLRARCAGTLGSDPSSRRGGQGKSKKPAGLGFESDNHIARWETLCEMARLHGLSNEYFKSVGSLELMIPAYTLRTGSQAPAPPQSAWTLTLARSHSRIGAGARCARRSSETTSQTGTVPTPLVEAFLSNGLL